MKNKTRISFDFDGTLRDNDQVQSLAATLSNLADVELYITTRRFKGRNFEDVEVTEIAEQLGIKESNVTYTNREFKYETLKRLETDIHIDDDPDELTFLPLGEINIFCILQPNWITEFYKRFEEIQIENRY